MLKTGPLIPSCHLIQHPDKQWAVRQCVAKAYGLRQARETNPAPNPVSIERKDFSKIASHHYGVAEKTDGVRYTLVLLQWPQTNKPVAVMWNRGSEMYEVRGVYADEVYFRGSVFDGELVWEYENGPNLPPRQVYWVYDTLMLGSDSYKDRPFLQRYETCQSLFDCEGQDVVKDPRGWFQKAKDLALKGRVVCEGNQYCLTFQPKRFYDKCELLHVWERKSLLKHKSDGLILVDMQETVHTGTDFSSFKWKCHHTIDLQWRAVQVNGSWKHDLWFAHEGELQSGTTQGIVAPRPLDSKVLIKFQQSRFIPLMLSPSLYLQTLVDYFERKGQTEIQCIVECSCRLPTDEEWSNDPVPVVECQIDKVRTDKNYPNNRRTIERTLVNIQENISVQELFRAVNVPHPSQ